MGRKNRRQKSAAHFGVKSVQPLRSHSCVAVSCRTEKANYIINNCLEDYSIYTVCATLPANNAFNNIPQELNVVNCTENKPIIENFKKLDFYCQKFSGEDLKKLVTSLVEEIIFNLTLVAVKKSEDLYVNSIVDMAIKFIDNNFTNPIGVDDICNILYISKSHLHHLFRDKLHISPKKYINLQRLEKARNMIRAGKKPCDVYLSCGFTDYATFYRNYKLYFSHIPSAENKIEIIRDIKS